MATRFYKLIISIALLLPQLLLAGDMQLKIIPLQNRLANDVVNIIRPLLIPGGTVTGMNNQLIIKTTPENLAEIKQILKSIDHAPRKLMISVKQNIDGNINIHENSITGSYTSKNVKINTGEDLSHEGLSISTGNKDLDIRLRTLEKISNIDDKNTFKVQTLEGRPAFINQGQSIPINSTTTFINGQRVVVNQSTDYHEVRSGFYVLPRLNGNKVTLLATTDLSSVKSGYQPSSNVQSVETTVTGRLGEWMELGGIEQNFNQNNRQNSSSSHQHGQESRTILIKVDEVK